MKKNGTERKAAEMVDCLAAQQDHMHVHRVLTSNLRVLPHVVVESLFQRVARRVEVTEAPLAHDACAIPCLLHHLGDREVGGQQWRVRACGSGECGQPF